MRRSWASVDRSPGRSRSGRCISACHLVPSGSIAMCHLVARWILSLARLTDLERCRLTSPQRRRFRCRGTDALAIGRDPAGVRLLGSLSHVSSSLLREATAPGAICSASPPCRGIGHQRWSESRRRSRVAVRSWGARVSSSLTGKSPRPLSPTTTLRRTRPGRRRSVGGAFATAVFRQVRRQPGSTPRCSPGAKAPAAWNPL